MIHGRYSLKLHDLNGVYKPTNLTWGHHVVVRNCNNYTASTGCIYVYIAYDFNMVLMGRTQTSIHSWQTPKGATILGYLHLLTVQFHE